MLSAVAVVAAGCSGGGSTNHAVAPVSTITTRGMVPTSTTAAPAMTCSPTTSGGKSGTGGGDVTPPGDIPDNQAFVAFASPGGQYSIKVPEGWARTDTGAVTSFTDKLNAIRVELKPSPAPPSVSSAQANDVPAIAAASRCFEAPKVATVQRHAGPAVLVTYRADSAADPVTGKVIHDDVEQYHFWRAGTEAVITLSSPQGSDNVDPWRTVTDSFAWSP